MSLPVLVIGRSGSGKTYSLKNFRPGEVGIISVEKGRLPFKSELKPVRVPNYADNPDIRDAGQANAAKYAWITNAIRKTGTIREQTPAVAEFVNTRKTGDLELTAETKDTLWLAIADMDTTKLELSSVSQPFANVLEATFTRNVYFDSAFTDTSNCYLESPEKKKLYPKLVYLSASTNKPQFYFDPAPKKEVLYKFICSAAKDSMFRTLDTLRNEVEWEWNKMEGDTLPPKVAGVKSNSKAKALFPDDSLVVYFNKPKLDSLQQTFYIAINKDTTQVQVKQIDPVRFAVENPEPWGTDIAVNFLMGYMDTTLAAADSNGKRDTVVELKYQKMQKFETVSKLKLAKLRGKIPGATSKTMVRLLSAETKNYYFENCKPDGSFSFDGLVEGAYLMDYYVPEEGKKLPDGGSVDPFRYGSQWRAINDTLKVKNGENVLDSLAGVVPGL